MDKQEATICARLAAAVYIDTIKVDNFLHTARFENVGTNTQGIFGVINKNTFAVVFRGSEETGIEDWITDLKFNQQVFPYEESNNKKVKVHYGFIWAYKSVREAVLQAARDTSHRRIVCVGHSLGAGLATLAALDIQYNLPEKEVACYTFGSPKVGNRAFVESYNRRVPETFRFVNGADIVPSLPPFGYAHVAEAIRVRVDDEDELADKVLDHLPVNYIKALLKLP